MAPTADLAKVTASLTGQILNRRLRPDESLAPGPVAQRENCTVEVAFAAIALVASSGLIDGSDESDLRVATYPPDEWLADLATSWLSQEELAIEILVQRTQSGDFIDPDDFTDLTGTLPGRSVLECVTADLNFHGQIVNLSGHKGAIRSLQSLVEPLRLCHIQLGRALAPSTLVAHASQLRSHILGGELGSARRTVRSHFKCIADLTNLHADRLRSVRLQVD